MEYEIYKKLKEAYETSTTNYNRFQAVINSIKWDDIFQADGETYYLKNGLTFTIENINPFKEAWKPSAMFADGSMLNF